MAVETFTWCVSVTSSGNGAFAVLSAPFGDGYKQEAGDGLNTDRQTWNIELRGKAADVNPALVFLRAHKGYKAFLWTPPLGVQGYYKAKAYSINPQGANNYILSASFEEDFKP